MVYWSIATNFCQISIKIFIEENEADNVIEKWLPICDNLSEGNKNIAVLNKFF